jgi:hypothetical protein
MRLPWDVVLDFPRKWVGLYWRHDIVGPHFLESIPENVLRYIVADRSMPEITRRMAKNRSVVGGLHISPLLRTSLGTCFPSIGLMRYLFPALRDLIYCDT